MVNPLTKLYIYFSRRAREKRAAVFRDAFHIDKNTKILDLGSNNGTNIKNILEGMGSKPENVYIADVNSQAVNEGGKKFGFNPVIISESGVLPFEDNYFDIVYCSSVIEHVTIPKEENMGLVLWSQVQGRISLKAARICKRIKKSGEAVFCANPIQTLHYRES